MKARTMKYQIKATYRAMVELVVEVEDDTTVEQAKDPASWLQIIDEQQVDYQLWDVDEVSSEEEDE